MPVADTLIKLHNHLKDTEIYIDGCKELFPSKASLKWFSNVEYKVISNTDKYSRKANQQMPVNHFGNTDLNS